MLGAVHVQERAATHHLVVEHAGAPGSGFREVLLVSKDRPRHERVAHRDAQSGYANDAPDPPQQLDKDEDDGMRGEVQRELVPACVPASQSLRP